LYNINGTIYDVTHGVWFVRKSDSGLMRAIDWLLSLFGFSNFMTIWWTTLRLPFGRPTIYFPDTVTDPLAPEWKDFVAHEFVHVDQQRTWCGLLKTYAYYTVLPLPVGLSGRWLLEREAWLVSIKAGCTITYAVGTLWSSYFKPWPKSWMRTWFENRTKESDDAAR